MYDTLNCVIVLLQIGVNLVLLDEGTPIDELDDCAIIDGIALGVHRHFNTASQQRRVQQEKSVLKLVVLDKLVTLSNVNLSNNELQRFFLCNWSLWCSIAAHINAARAVTSVS